MFLPAYSSATAADASVTTNAPPPATAPLPTYGIEVFAAFLDTGHLHKGLAFGNGDLYESTGQYGRLHSAKLDPQTGKVLKSWC